MLAWSSHSLTAMGSNGGEGLGAAVSRASMLPATSRHAKHATRSYLSPASQKGGPIEMTDKPNPTRRLFKVKQAAVYLGISARRVRQLAQEQELRVVKLFGTRGPWLFDVKDLEQLIEAHKELA
jgi:excisionase family DNA binding protein